MILMYFYINKYRINAALVIKRGFQNIVFNSYWPQTFER